MVDIRSAKDDLSTRAASSPSAYRETRVVSPSYGSPTGRRQINMSFLAISFLIERTMRIANCFLILLVFATFAPSSRAAEPPPNLIFILADDLGWGELGCYGQKIIRTPSIDRLAKEGMRFTQFYSGSPVCAPARCTLMTGKHTGHSYIRDNREVKPEGQVPLAASETTIAKLFHDRGYRTAAIGKWGLGMPTDEGDPHQHGFDSFFGYYCQRHAHNHYPSYLWRDAERFTLEGNPGKATGKQHTHDLFEAEALKFLDANREHPFFLYLPVTISHLALQIPDEELAPYAELPETEVAEKSSYFPHPKPRAAYAAMVSRLDRTVGKVVERVKQLGLEKNTIIVFSSDNGPTYGRLGGADSDFFQSAGDLRARKGSVYEGGIRVPLIARWPDKIPSGTTSDFAGYFPDLMPTLWQLTHGDFTKLPRDIDGISFAATLASKANEQKPHDFLLWEFPSYGGQQAVRIGNWKGVRQGLVKWKGKSPWELYDLKSDPNEKRDLAAERPEIVAQIAKLIKEQRSESKLFPLAAE